VRSFRVGPRPEVSFNGAWLKGTAEDLAIANDMAGLNLTEDNVLEYLCFYWRMLRPFVCVTDGQDGLNRLPHLSGKTVGRAPRLPAWGGGRRGLLPPPACGLTRPSSVTAGGAPTLQCFLGLSPLHAEACGG
jgi:hypothetical protein